MPEGAGSGTQGAWFPRWFWPSFAAPATLWLILFFVVPFYVILGIAFGQLDQIFLTPIPVYNPLHWDPTAFVDVVQQFTTGGSIYQSALWHTLIFVGISTLLCLLIGYPVAYFIARHAGRSKTLFLVLFIAPFWISYMMRMLGWMNLLQPNGYVNRILQSLGLIDQPIQWLNGKPLTVILGLTYGYIPYMILPLYGTLDRISSGTLEASRDLGAGQTSTFLRVTLPLSRQGILAGIVIVMLPMFGDYYTTNLLASTRNTAMVGTLIVSSMGSSLVQQGASLVLLLLIALLFPMLYYLRETSRAAELVSGA
ncbi:MAG TPA: ABC transporter permease [Actinomycetota bacterium]|nr:ABC transporter permease [Actinomycetota bacterium]